MTRVLLLGGTFEASQMARRLAAAGIDAVFSYAGRTDTPNPQPLPTRIGGFGGIDGLVRYLRAESITAVIDATHPFAARMSGNAVDACTQTGTRLLALERAPWVAGSGDRWHAVPDTDAAVAALPAAPTRIFLAIGRQTLAPFLARPAHHYLLRFIDPPDVQPLPGAEIIVGRGPFTLEGDTELMKTRGITCLVAKNSGSASARAKLDAARLLGIPVIMIDRPALAPRATAGDIETAMKWLLGNGHHDADAHVADLGAKT